MKKSADIASNEMEDKEIGSTPHAISSEDGAIQKFPKPITGTNARELVYSQIERSSCVPEDAESPRKDGSTIKKTSKGLLPVLYSEEEKEMEFSTSLTENTYSLIYIVDPKSWAFYVGIAFFLFQAALPLLALIELTDRGSKNFFKAPADIEGYVRVAGYLTLMLSVPLFRDLLDSIETFHEGYHPSALEHSPHATKWKWSLSIALQFISGLLFQFIIFVLVAQATSVIGMLLNFAGKFLISSLF